MAADGAAAPLPPPTSYDWGSDDDDDVDGGDDKAAPTFAPVEGAALPEGRPLVVTVGPLPGVAFDAALRVSEWEAVGSVEVAGSPSESVLPSTTTVKASKAKAEGGEDVVLLAASPVALPSGHLNQWAAALLDGIVPSMVEIAVELPTHMLRYDGAAADEGSKVYTIKTDAAVAAAAAGGVDAAEAPTLPPANIVSGPTAAVFTLCQARRIPARVTVAYRRQGGTLRGADAAAFAAFDAVVAAAIAKGAPAVPAEAAAALRKGAIEKSWADSQAAGGLMYL
mmetsp:Transcript_37343/g.97888  ORF Transcript_37343/g.97888 Transcript_37343/m.97888 type:complete len:281 (+) Transcript_37343:143-985(+)